VKEYIGILGHDIDLVLPGFERLHPKGVFKCAAFDNRSSEEWFLSFVTKVKSAISNRFLPIYRMADGEYRFCVGKRHPFRDINESRCYYFVRTLGKAVREFRYNLLRKPFSAGGRNYISGNYEINEVGVLRKLYAAQLRLISQRGLLALNFAYRQKPVMQQYFVPIMAWLNEQNIILHEMNYCPFHFVYALLTGPYRHQIYQKRRVLIVTSFDDTKRTAITNGLKREGVSDIQFFKISQGQSMYDIVDLSAIKQPIDLVLIGAGIGASNILCQLQLLNTVVIDAGYIIECLADPERKKQRAFCWPDKERFGEE